MVGASLIAAAATSLRNVTTQSDKELVHSS